MTDETTTQPTTNRDDAWAKPVDKLTVGDTPTGAMNLNVDGRGLTGPLQGFGQLWQKTYRIRLEGAEASPQDVTQTVEPRSGPGVASPCSRVQRRPPPHPEAIRHRRSRRARRSSGRAGGEGRESALGVLACLGVGALD